jgi:NAD(P)-dependent dehydrogenase (short-subunit alcohol dehydrogenase family)
MSTATGSAPRLQGTSAIVTGGGSGMGAATALAMARDGAAVAVVDIVGAHAQATVDTIVAGGGRAIATVCDVSDVDQVRDAFDAATTAHGVPTALFNNAGISGTLVPAPETPIEEFDRCVAVNLRGVFIVAAEFVRGARAATRSASAVNTASINSFYVEPNAPAYCATKGAVVALTRAMALDHAREGIRINCVCPGQVLSPMTQPLYEAVPGGLEAAEQLHPLGRIGQPEDIASMVTYLCSDEASFITGAVFVVDGGLTIGTRVVSDSELYGAT